MSDWTDRAEEIAREKGLVVHRPQSNELFVDIDDAAGLGIFDAHLPILGDLVVSHSLAKSPSGKPHRFHARVILSRDVADEFERIFLQTLLGSDRLHEVLSWRAATRGVTNVTVFFEKPEQPEASAECPY